LRRGAALSFVQGLPASVHASLLVFGQQGNSSEGGKAKSCSAIDIVAPMSTDRGGFRTALGQVRAVGWTPLAAALDRAETLLSASSVPGEQIIYVVADGEETCGGDPVAAAKRINKGRTRAIVNVIGFQLPASEAAKLAAVARGGGGSFANFSNEAELARFDAQVRESIRQTNNEVATSIATTDTTRRPASPSPTPKRASAFLPRTRTWRCRSISPTARLRGSRLHSRNLPRHC
jgi:Ca-activated chloride channel family protein